MSETLELDDIQGLVARGYGSLGEATFVLLEIADPALARAWLGALSDRVTPGSTRPDDRALHVAIAAGGLAKLGLASRDAGTRSRWSWSRG